MTAHLDLYFEVGQRGGVSCFCKSQLNDAASLFFGAGLSSSLFVWSPVADIATESSLYLFFVFNGRGSTLYEEGTSCSICWFCCWPWSLREGALACDSIAEARNPSSRLRIPSLLGGLRLKTRSSTPSVCSIVCTFSICCSSSLVFGCWLFPQSNARGLLLQLIWRRARRKRGNSNIELGVEHPELLEGELPAVVLCSVPSCCCFCFVEWWSSWWSVLGCVRSGEQCL